MAKRRGVYVRNAPDWLFTRLAVASGYQSPAQGEYAQVWLYNNGSVGSRLRVYGLAIGAGGSPAFVDTSFTEGPPASGSKGTVHTVDPSSPPIPGAVYLTIGATVPGSIVRLPIPSGGFSAVVDWPLFIIPAGWSMVVAQSVVSEYLMPTWWYVATDE